MAKSLPFGRGYAQGEDAWVVQQQSFDQRRRDLDRAQVLKPTTIKTAAYDAQPGDLVRCDTTTAFTVTLPNAIDTAGYFVGVKKTTTDTNAVTLVARGTQTIDGDATKALSKAEGAIYVISDGANWWILNSWTAESLSGAWDSANFTGTNWTDLTDTGATTLHKHDHGGQDGLADDDHTQYALLLGRSGGQTLIGGTASGNDLTLQSTSNATKGDVFLGTNSTFSEANTRLGIGITTPDGTIHAHTASVGSVTAVTNADDLVVENTTNTGISILADTLCTIAFGDVADADIGAIDYSHSDNSLGITVNAAEVMSIDSSGNVGINIQIPSTKLDVRADSASNYGLFVFNDGNSTNRWGIKVNAGPDAPTTTGDIRWAGLNDGDGSGVSFIQYLSSTPFAQFASASDERLKENIRPSSVNGSQIINDLQMYAYEWKDKSKNKPAQSLGFVAQQAQAVFPEMVSVGDDGMLVLGDGCLIKVLVKAFQEQTVEINQLKADVVALQSELTVIKEKLPKP